jgi:hypothetical protein
VTGFDVALAVVASVLGALLSRCTRLHAGWALVAAVLGLLVAVGALRTVPVPVASFVVPIGFVMSAMAWHWRRQPAAAHRVAGHLERGSMRSVAGAELASAWPLVVAAGLAAVGVTIALAAPGTVVPLVGIAIAAVPVVAMARRSPAPHVSTGVALPSETVTIIEDGSPDRRVAEALAARSRSRAVACHPPHLFRGLAGWNLGLGLGDEEAAWAGQLARMLGLGPVLAEPAPLLDARQAKLLAVCRAVANGGDPVILDEPVAELEPGDVRALARVVGIGVGDRRLIVVTADPGGHRSFVSRARTRP